MAGKPWPLVVRELDELVSDFFIGRHVSNKRYNLPMMRIVGVVHTESAATVVLCEWESSGTVHRFHFNIDDVAPWEAH